MKIQIFSDVHLGINNIEPEDILDSDADLYLDAGDTGEAMETDMFYKKSFWNNKNVLFISGNHTYYNNIMSGTDDYFEKAYNSNILYFNNKYKIINDVVFIGSTLWTDFQLFDSPDNCMRKASAVLNDFYYIQTTKKSIFTPKDSIQLFKNNIKFIKKTVEQFSDKKIVVLTHHAPSIKSSLERYKDNLITACFASNIEQFILDHQNIIAWVHGHVHNHNDYMIGNTRIISNPIGYCDRGEKSGYKRTYLEI